MSYYWILLANDNPPGFLETVKDFLEEIEGVEVVGMLESGEAALNQILDLSPDLVLLDLVMPGIDGVTVTRLIKASFPDVQVILLTLHDLEEYRQAALDAGAAAYVV